MRDKSQQFNFTIAYIIIIIVLYVAGKIVRHVVLYSNYEVYKHERES